MGEHRRTKIPEKFALVPTEGLSKLQRAWLMIGIFACTANSGFPGAMTDSKSNVTELFDWIALVVGVTAVIAALLTWFLDGLVSRYLVSVVSVFAIAMGLVDLWLCLFQHDLPLYPGQGKAEIFAACVVILGFFSFSTNQIDLSRASGTRS
jgi:hypothetical protein